MAPVVSAALGAFGPLLVKLTALLANECGRLKGVRREIRSLRSELASMHAALKEYTKLEDPSDQVKTWIWLLRELAYDTEDVFDKFIHQLGNGQNHGGFKEFFRKTARRLKTLGSRRRIADQIDDLKDRIKLVKELKDSYKLNDAPSSFPDHAAVDPRLQAVFAEEAHLVGVDGPRDDLAKWIVEENESRHCKVLSIVGFGGLGKTTLANEVYRMIQGQFCCWAFVSVSQKPDIKKIIKDVISQVSIQDGSKKDTNDWDEKKYIAELREMLQDKRYLIIIDDIWSTPAWNTIKCAFPENNRSSRIIATTRIIDVAKSCCPRIDDRLHEMEPLSDAHCRRLFFKRIFGSDDHCPDTLSKVSSEILKKCGGLPLAIISISSLLANRSATKQEWEKVKRSIGSALENNQNLEGMNSILCLSYNDLSPNLKTCLLYLSVFPEDFVIDRERLVRRWIAEGFISEERGQSRQEVAENYFYELINKSMVQPLDIGCDGKARACRVHDMMLEIIISKSAEDNFTTVVGGGQTSLASRQGFIRRLSIQYIDQELASALANEDLSHVRSLTITPSCSTKYLPSLVQFEALRVLDFEDCYCFNSDMKNINKLFHLRYLCLKGTFISELPSQVVMLTDLETLDFRNTMVEDLPAGFVRLTKLQYLLSGSLAKIPSGIGNMSNLQVISNFNATMSPADALIELGELTSLNELYVNLGCKGFKCGGPGKYKRHEEKLFFSLQKLIGRGKLKSLHINCWDGHSLEFLESLPPIQSALEMFVMTTNYYFKNIPNWISPALTNIAILAINLTKLTENCLHNLGEFPALLHLCVMLETRADRITVQGIGFPSLQHFEISYGKGAYITFLKGAMPKLEYLVLELDVSAGRNYGFYLGIVHLPCLKRAKIWVQSEGATKSEIIAAGAAIKEEVYSHANHPRIIIGREEEKGKTGNDEEKRKEDLDIEANYREIVSDYGKIYH